MKLLLNVFARKVALSLALFALSINLLAQNDYYPLKSQGTIPREFLTLSSEKYEQDKATINKEDKRSTRNAQDEFFLKSNYGIDKILRGGKVVFNDTISNYLNKIKDVILKDDPTNRDKIRIYVTRSSAVNAFATNSGVILVNLGLISQLETEAQLAYVLCHEIVHVLKKHTINEYVEAQQIKKGQGEYQGLSSNAKELAVCRYSQDTELEADLEGLELFKKTPYSSKTIDNVFYVLQYAYLPFNDLVFDKTFFDTPTLKVPSTYFAEKVNDIKGDSAYDDSKSSHPDPRKRLEAVTAKLPTKIDTSKTDYIVSKEDFFWCREKSRWEICRILLLNRKYEEAIYHTYLLLKTNPDSKYLKKTIAKAMYGISKYKTEGKFYKVHEDQYKIEGESHQVYYFFDKIADSELSAITTSYIWKLRSQYPDDVELKMMSEDLMNSMVSHHFQDKGYFFREGPTPVDTNSVVEAEVDTTSKYARIKKKLKGSNELKDEPFIRYAFVENFSNPDFEKSFDKKIEFKKQQDSRSSEAKYQEREKLKSDQRRTNKRGYRLGIDHVVMIDPFYARINTRRKEAYRFQFTEQKQLELNKMLQDAGAQVGVKTDLLTPLYLSPQEVAAMNDFSLMEDWINERLEHIEDLDTSLFVSPIQMEVAALAQKYGTPYFGWSGMVWYTESNPAGPRLLLISIIYPFMLPVAAYELATPEHRTLQYTMLFDINSGREKMHHVKYYKNKEIKKFSSAGLYYTFLQIKKPAKK